MTKPHITHFAFFTIILPFLYISIGFFQIYTYSHETTPSYYTSVIDKLIDLRTKEQLDIRSRPGKPLLSEDFTHLEEIESPVLFTKFYVSIKYTISGFVIQKISTSRLYKINYSDFIIAIGLWVFSTVALKEISLVMRNVISYYISERRNNILFAAINESKEKSSDSPREPPAKNPSECLYFEIQNLNKSAKDLLLNSYFLLICGVSLALVGLAAFYFSHSTQDQTDNLALYTVKELRPAMVLIFMEAIAWFLLKQYRVMLLEQRGLFDKISDRTNLLLAINMHDEEISKGQMDIIKGIMENQNKLKLIPEGTKSVDQENNNFLSENSILELAKVGLQRLMTERSSSEKISATS